MPTVSRILRDKGADSFADETCERVRRAAKELGWRPNLLVRGMQTGRTGTVGILAMPFDAHWARVLSAIQQELVRTDRVPVVAWPEYGRQHQEVEADLFDEAGLLDNFLARCVDAIIAWPLYSEAATAFLQDHCAREVTVITIDHQLTGPNPSFAIQSDESNGMKQIVSHLHDLGHRRLAYIGKESRHAWAHDRHQAFVRAAEDYRLESSHLAMIDERDRASLGVIRDLLVKQRPTAIVCATDHLAYDAWSVAHDLRIRIPEDLSITGYADIDHDLMFLPRLTTIDQSADVIGRLAAELSSQPRDQLTPEECGTKKLIQPRLIVGETTGVTH